MPGIDQYTKLMLHMDGFDGSTTFTDSSLAPKTVTANGNAQIDTAKSKFGGASGVFDGAGDYVSLMDSVDWYLGTGDLTFDFWVNFNVLPANGAYATIAAQYDSVTAAYNLYAYLFNTAGTYSWRLISHVTDINDPITFFRDTVIATNTWYHIAVVRSGTSFYWFQDGTQLGTTLTDSDPMSDISGVLSVGALVISGTGYQALNGWVEELRFSKGVARWISNFTPPTVEYDSGLTEAAIRASAPYMPLFASPHICLQTCGIVIDELAAGEIRLGANGSLGGFWFSTPDPAGIIRQKLAEHRRISIRMIQGTVDRTYTGILESPSRSLSPVRRGGAVTTISGRGYGKLLARRNKAVNYSNRDLYDILTNASDGLKTAVTEITWGDYVRNPSKTISTDARKRTVMDVHEELMLRSGSATQPWTFWACHGEHAGEWGKENIHYREKTRLPSPIIITSDEVFSAEVLGTEQFIDNAVEVEYGTAGATTTRTSAASQTIYGVLYRYTWAPFLTALADAENWGDQWLLRAAASLKAISLTVPLNFLLEPNYTIRYVDEISDDTYEISTVMHRWDQRESYTTVTAATTL